MNIDLTCRYCGSLRKNKNSHVNHERTCKSNPDRNYTNNWPKTAWNKGIPTTYATPLRDDQVFVEHSTYSRTSLKKRILKSNLIAYKCAICSMLPIWNGKDLVLQLDHINGINDDNRLENLRFLCPNCHTQTDTFSAKNRRNSNRSKKAYYKNGVKFNAPLAQLVEQDTLNV